MDWSAASIKRDDRFAYDEIRLNALVPLGDRLYNVTFTERGETLRVISVRRANNPEKTYYARHL